MLKEELETIIRFDRLNGKSLIWTSDPKMMRKFDKLYPKVDETVRGGEITSRTYETDKKHISFRIDPSYKDGSAKKKNMSPTQLANLKSAKK